MSRWLKLGITSTTIALANLAGLEGAIAGEKLEAIIPIQDNSADVKVIVNWQASIWNLPAPKSERIVLDAYQTRVVKRSRKTQKPVIQVYIVDSMEYTEGSARL